MRKAESRRLVIDASIAQAAGGEAATFPASKRCRDFLKSMLSVCHHVVMTKDIRAEWDAHQSGFARQWRYSMVARKKMACVEVGIGPERQRLQTLTEAVRGSDLTDNQQDAVEKDLHLAVAALETDQRVAANDEVVRELLGRLSGQATDLTAILWINPTIDHDRAIEWLERGAPDEPSRRLGAASSGTARSN